MAITSLSGIGAGQPQNVQNAGDKLFAALASIVSGNSQSTGDVVAIATQLQSQTAALKVVSGNLAQASSLAQVAAGGIGQIQQVISQLQSLASQAGSPVLNADNRKQLNQQFQQLAGEIDSIAGTTSFNGQNILDGSLSLPLDSLLNTNSNSGNDLSVADQSTASLFGGRNLNLLSSDSASQALTTLGDALNQIIGTQANVGAFQQTLDFAGANVDSAIINQQAAQSAISDTDVAAASTQSSLASIQYNAAIAAAAQGNLLNPALLKLVG